MNNCLPNQVCLGFYKWTAGVFTFLTPSISLLIISAIPTRFFEHTGKDLSIWLLFTVVLAALVPAGLILSAPIKFWHKITFVLGTWCLWYVQVIFLGSIVFGHVH